MKKLSIILLLAIFPAFIYGQAENENCITCDSNMVDFTKGASAIGSKNISTGTNSFAAGYLNEASGDYSFANGYYSNALGDNSIAMGKTATANGIQSVAIGLLSEATGNASLALGAYTKTLESALLSIALGSRVTAGVERSMAIGFGISDFPIENNISNSLMVGFYSNLPTFFVSASSGLGTTGKIGIGDVTNPLAKLHIKADNNENATLKLETTGTNTVAKIFLADDVNTITSISGGGMSFHTNETGNFKFINGNLGIGLNAPETKLDVDGTIKSTGFKLVDGTQAYGRMLQSDDQGNATWVDAPGSGCVQCDNTSNTGEYSTTLGQNTTASDFASFASGYEVSSTNAFSFAHGKFISCSGTNSFALGSYLDANQHHCFVLGHGYNNDNHLENNIGYSLMIGFGSNVPTFFVEGYHGMNRTGKIGIGNVTAPQAKLHIRADENYDTASVYIQTFDDTKDAYLWMGNKNFGLKKHNTSLEFLSTENFVFNEGSLGIGTDDPQAKVHVKDGDIFIEDINHGIVMKSPDGNCWRGTLNNQGQMQFTQINCDDLTVSTPENKPQQNSGIRIFPNPAGNRVFIEFDTSLQELQLEITNINGEMILSKRLNNAESYVDLSNFRSGVYVFKMMDSKGKIIESKKVIKE